MSRKTKLILIILIFAFAYSTLGGARSYAADDADDIEDKIEDKLDEKEKAEKELQAAQNSLQKNQTQISVTKNLIVKTETEITRNEKEIDNLNNNLELNKKILENYIREAYYLDQDPMTDFILSGQNISDVTINFEQIFNVKDKIVATVNEISDTKSRIEDAQANLAEKKDDHEKLYSIQQGQQYEIKSDIKEAQATLAELNAEIDKLRSQLSKLLGSAVSFKNVMDAAKFAAKVTGIRKDYLLGVLVVESNLGRYTGGCTADKSKMSSYRLGIFKNICEELDYNWKKQKVSCPPSGYKGSGGAMGVAQFMPDTWQGYKSSIASVTGHNPPDPWNLTDGVVAMALKLTKVDGVKAHKKSAEAKAYCVYLAGGNWAAYCDNKGVNYGEKVLYWADNYEKVMD